MVKSVRKGVIYKYDPVNFDRILQPPVGNPKPGAYVKCVNPPGIRMKGLSVRNHVWIEDAFSGRFLGMCFKASLESLSKTERAKLRYGKP